jgi:hypothetical protein
VLGARTVSDPGRVAEMRGEECLLGVVFPVARSHIDAFVTRAVVRAHHGGTGRASCWLRGPVTGR